MYEVNKDTGEFRNKQSKKPLSQYKHYSRNADTEYYNGVHLRNINNKCTSYLAHRVILNNFVPFRRIDQDQVNHIDCIRNHNYLDNLEWCSPKENMEHALEYGSVKRGEDVYNSTFTDTEVRTICELLEKGESYKNILSIIGKENTDNNRDYIGNIKRRKTYRHISKDFNW